MYLKFGKRVCDIIVSVIALPFMLIIIGITAPFIYFEDKGPIFYNATRMGRNGKPFKMYKLRSMKMNAPEIARADGTTFNSVDDPRVTRTGAFLRKTSIDEVPQFLNVLKGNMSVIGPRPHLKRETELYEGNESDRLRMKPGITGYAAVYGRNQLSWHDRLACDVFYVHNVTFLLDLKIFFRTFVVIFKREGVFEE